MSSVNKRFISAEDVNIECPFANLIDFSSISSWDEVEVLAASSGSQISQPIFRFFIVGMMTYRSIMDMMISAFEERTWMIDKLKSLKDMSLLYTVSSADHTFLAHHSEIDLYRMTLSRKWFKAANMEFISISDKTVSPLSPTLIPFSQTEKTNIVRERLFNAIDITDPFILLKFYSQFKKTVFSDDIAFLKYLLKRTAVKAKYHRFFADAYRQLKTDLDEINKYNMFIQ